MSSYQRKNPRHSVFHLKFIHLNIIGKDYPVIDLSAGGISLVDDRGVSGLKRGIYLRGTELKLGPFKIKIDFEVVFADKDNGIFGLKVDKYHGKSKKILNEFTESMNNGVELKDVSVELKDNGWILETPKLKFWATGEEIKVLKKPMLMKEEKALFHCLAYASGLDKDKFPAEKMVNLLLSKLK